MDKKACVDKARNHLHKLCTAIPTRRVGSEGNRLATEYFAEVMRKLEFQVETPEFACVDWEDHGAILKAGGEAFEVFSSPYSLGCRVEARLVAASTVEELEAVEAEGKVLLLHGEITQEQLMPKNFTFYNPEHHQQLVALLETKNSAAILTATGRNPELAGGMYPFPLIEDGDFDIPSVYLKDVEGERLVKYAGARVSLEINARRIPSNGFNVIARKGENIEQRIVLCAHIDAKDNTPGALDNATGVVMLLILGELLGGEFCNHMLEIVALNGEDHYSAQGHKEYTKSNQGKFDQILLAINTDVAGYKEGKTAYSLYGCPEEIARPARLVFSKFKGMEEGEQWYQSDHSIFIQNQRPAIAFTSDQFMALSTHITHTPKDNPDLVDYDKLVDVAFALKEFIFLITR